MATLGAWPHGSPTISSGFPLTIRNGPNTIASFIFAFNASLAVALVISFNFPSLVSPIMLSLAVSTVSAPQVISPSWITTPVGISEPYPESWKPPPLIHTEPPYLSHIVVILSPLPPTLNSFVEISLTFSGL